MQISDLVGQYHNSSERPQMTGTTGVSKIVSSLKDMGSGNIFEGTVNSVRGGQVVLALSNGQTVTARLEGKVSLNVGQSMFFQVKSNDGGTISIKPYTIAGNRMNITLMDALKAAGLPVNERNLAMVDAMMNQQMSIDKNSLNEMAKVLASNSSANVQTLVQMQKLGIPTTVEFTSQFENYMQDKQAITDAMDAYVMELPKTLANENLSTEQLQQMGREILTVITEELPEDVELPKAADVETGVYLDVTVDDVLANGTDETAVSGANGELGAANGAQNVQPQAIPEAVPYTLGSVLDEAELAQWNQSINRLLGSEAAAQETIAEGETLPEEALQFTRTDSTVSVLRAVMDFLDAGPSIQREQLLELFSGKPFAALMKDALAQQWLLKPQELGGSDQINTLYEKIENQLERLESIVKTSGQEAAGISQLATEIRSNVQFMDQINQAYTYVQIPLKLSGQSASGELYVYTNKKNLQEQDGELSAFLHLDMEHLGPTDVSVRLRGRQVHTKFYFEDDATYDLVQANLEQLSAKLEAKGYQCNAEVVSESRHVNFVDDFLKKDVPSGGLVHRYSFDMRA